PLGWVGRFDVRTGKSGRLWEFTTEFRSAAFTPDGSAVILNGSPREPHNPQRPPLQPEAPDPRTAVVRFDVAQGVGCTPFDSPEGANEARFRTTFALAVAPTGYQFAVDEQDSTITLYETATGAVRRQFRGHRNQIEQLAFTPDGQRLVSVSHDLTGLVWDVSPPKPATRVPWTDAGRRQRWDDLGSSDGQAAYRAMGELAADPAEAVATLKAHLKYTPPPSDYDVDRLVARLDAEAFAAREAAARELDRLGGLAVRRVRETLPRVQSAEVRRRLEGFLGLNDRPGRVTGCRLQERRALELLEAVRTAEARGALEGLAGDGDTPLSRDAAAARKRLEGK